MGWWIKWQEPHVGGKVECESFPDWWNPTVSLPFPSLTAFLSISSPQKLQSEDGH